MESTVLRKENLAANDHSVVSGAAGALLYMAQLVGFSDCKPLMRLPGSNCPVRAVAQATPLTEDDIGSRFVVMLDCGGGSRPIVIGKLADNEQAAPASTERIEIEADEELVLKCGKACVKMTSDGTVAIRGANVITRASHTNRIRGGNVQIN